MLVMLRQVQPEDLPVLRAINDAAIPAVTATTVEELTWFTEVAPYFKVAEAEGRPVGFLIGLTHGVTYDSPNYRWFEQRYERFTYVDRIVIDERLRGAGLGRQFYRDFERFSRLRAPVMTCEVNLRPRNDTSIHFHARYGFEEVGTQEVEHGAKEVVLLAKDLDATPERSREDQMTEPGHPKYLGHAIDEARQGLAEGGIPIGSVLRRGDRVIGRGHNRRVQDGDPITHAEIDCLRNAGRQRTYRDTVLYSTLMPCYLCAGAVIQFKIPVVVVGEATTFSGAESLLREHGVSVTTLDDPECISLMRDFIGANPEVWDEDIGE